MTKNNRTNLSQVTQTHRANLLKNLEHRLEVARMKGEKDLISQLEAEKRYYL